MIYQVLDQDFEEIQNREYDIGIFASGYESRCTFIPRQLSVENVKKPIVLAFEELSGEPQRHENDAYFAETWTDTAKMFSADEDVEVYNALNSNAPEKTRSLSLLVDYSSMSRLWYASILNWARFVEAYDDIYIDFTYALGDHREDRTPMVINDISCLPGCEGVPLTAPTVAVFGLGFEGLASLCVLDQVEPAKTYTYWASPAAFDDYPQKVVEANQELIENSEGNLELPLFSVQSSFSMLIELVAPDRANADVVLIPMGAKPHVLASILLALKYPEFACLRVSARQQKSKDIRGTGTPVCTRVQFKKSAQN